MVKFVMKNKNLVSIDPKAKIGENVILYENVRIVGASVIEDNVTIFPNTRISNSVIGKGSKITSSEIDSSEVGACCSIGAFTCILSGSKIASFVKIGCGSIIKNSEVDSHSEIGHGVVVCGSKIGKDSKVCAAVVLAGPCDKTKPKIEVGNGVVVGARACVAVPARFADGETIEAGSVVKGHLQAKI